MSMGHGATGRVLGVCDPATALYLEVLLYLQVPNIARTAFYLIPYLNKPIEHSTMQLDM